MSRAHPFFLAAALLAAGPARADVVTDWNATVIETAVGSKWVSIRGTRAAAIVQAAVFDAVNAVDHRFQPYIYHGDASAGASDVAAVSQAAFRVLSALAPDRAAALSAQNERILSAVTDGAALGAGVAVGDAAAQAVLAARQDDGFDDSVDPPPPPGPPGAYQPTAPGPMYPQHFPRMRPFGLSASADFRLPPPPPLDSPQFLRDLAEVRAKGDAAGAPSAEHVAIATFHVPSGFIAWNDIARQAIVAHKLDVALSARTLALLNFALSDSFEASFESKNAYQFWRPLTAIRAGGSGFGHPELKAVPEWASIIAAPMFAEYPCMHCAVGSAGQAVLETLFPDGQVFTVTSGGGQRRSFASFRAYAEEEAESRILGGVHYRWSAVAGEAQGRLVAGVDLTLLRPVE